MKRITTEDALRALEEAVAEKGEDYTYPRVPDKNGYPSCYYVVDGAPSCIAGHALRRLGVPLPALTQFEGTVPSGLAAAGAFDAEEGALDALDEAQRIQDQGGTWGEALAEAREVTS